ncbi:MAG: hypothetical protein NC911_04955 [Candidatus Omnitrophica bacterium]|nr:hypothetical protein [Candidatus Omnitrophota bacterium]
MGKKFFWVSLISIISSLPGSAFSWSWARGEIHGSWRNQTVFPSFPERKNSYTDNSTRLRLQLTGQPGQGFNWYVSYDLEWHLGDFTRSPDFALLEAVEQPTFLDLNGVLVEEKNFRLSHGLYRVFCRFTSGNIEVTAGRQAVDWGSGRAWNIINPFPQVNPLDIERSDRQGTDGLKFSLLLDNALSFTGVIAGKSGLDTPLVAGCFRYPLWQADALCVGYSDGRQNGFGFDFSRSIRSAEVHGAALYEQGEKTFSRFVLGMDYSFASTFKFALEYYHNGKGNRPGEYQWWSLLKGEEQFLAKDYGYWAMDYEVTPLLRFQHTLLVNLGDGGVYLNPVVKYSPRSNTEISLGWASFVAGSGDEFFDYPDFAYLRVQIFF